MIQLQGSPVTPLNSNSSSSSDQPAPWVLSEEFDSGTKNACYAGGKELLGAQKHSILQLYIFCVLEWIVSNYEGNMEFIEVQKKLIYLHFKTAL